MLALHYEVLAAYNEVISRRGYLVLASTFTLKVGDTVYTPYSGTQPFRIMQETTKADADIQIDLMAELLGVRYNGYVGYYYRLVTD